MMIEPKTLEDIARKFGTPTYVYNERMINEACLKLKVGLKKFDVEVCYAVKANGNLSILRKMGEWGIGADVVSGGELFKSLKAGISPERIVFSGVGKQFDELKMAVSAGIKFISIESVSEIEMIERVARELNCEVPVSIRLNLDVDAKTHAYISTGKRENKFGMSEDVLQECLDLLARSKRLKLKGLSIHIGSQIISLDPIRIAVEKLRERFETLRRRFVDLTFLDIGGGLGVDYDDTQQAPSIEAYIAMLDETLSNKTQGFSGQLVIEPGRSIIAKAGVLLSRVIRTKVQAGKSFAIVDAGMNDFLRPALYGAQHGIMQVNKSKDARKVTYDVVGPICESADIFAQAVVMDELSEGNLLAILDVGAYGFSMSSQYNAHPRAAEVMVGEDGTYSLIRRRETYEDLIQHEI